MRIVDANFDAKSVRRESEPMKTSDSAVFYWLADRRQADYDAKFVSRESEPMKTSNLPLFYWLEAQRQVDFDA